MSVYYNGLKFHTKAVVDKRLYVEEMTTAELTKSFGDGGKYADDSIFVFNKLNAKFYQYTGGGALDVSNWQMLVDTAASFPTWDNQTTYAKTSCVSLEDDSNKMHFFIAIANTTSGSSPLNTASEWFEIGNSTASTSDVFRESINHRLDPDDSGSHEITMFFDKSKIPPNTQPNVAVYGDFGETESANYKKWEHIHPKIETWVTDTLFKVKVSLTGDLSDFLFDDNDNTQKNLRILVN